MLCARGAADALVSFAPGGNGTGGNGTSLWAKKNKHNKKEHFDTRSTYNEEAWAMQRQAAAQRLLARAPRPL